ncbi:MAG: TIGR02391 family protein [Chloroflexi bacterium]|nr:TIGR02391 family protein [Chloroflexota bacterium]
MNLETQIQKELWENICTAYESGNYSHAILDAIHYLTDNIRSKTGLDGDGISLINSSLGGNSPKLRINKFQTKTEKSEQEGLKFLLMGLYEYIRNPRSHESIKDKQKQADTIIAFIDYLLTELSKSQIPFTIEDFQKKVFDPDFVQSNTYSKLLVDEIPQNKLLDTFIEIYRRKEDTSAKTISLILLEIISRLDEIKQKEVYAIISDELAVTQNFKSITRILGLFTQENWQKINLIPRMRIENKILNSLKQGEVDPFNWDSINKEGALATWANQILMSFEKKSDLFWIFMEKLDDITEATYLLEYFGNIIPELFSDEYNIKKIVSILNGYLDNYPEFANKIESFILGRTLEWQNKFLEALEPLNKDLFTKINEEIIPF